MALSAKKVPNSCSRASMGKLFSDMGQTLSYIKVVGHK